MPKLFLGVDGGQSSTAALIGDETSRVLGVGYAGPCNHVEPGEGRAKFIRVIKQCVESACAQAGIPPPVHFSSACLGFSGGPADKQAIIAEILSSDRILVTDDALIALSGATTGEPGIITIAGTGSIAFGRNQGGRIARAGGWGYIFGDEGGAFDIVRRALRAALSFEEGWGQPTSLRASLLAATGASDLNHLLHLFYTSEYPRSRVAAFATLIDQEAEDKDSVALQVLNDAAHALASLARAVRNQLFAPSAAVHICYIGGVFRSRILRGKVRALLESDAPNQVSPPAHGPAAGALIEAYRAAGIRCELSNVPCEKPHESGNDLLAP